MKYVTMFRRKVVKLLKQTKANLKIVDIIIGLFIAGVMLPTALYQIANGNYTGVDASVKTMATVLLPVLAVIAIVYVFLRRRG